MTITVPKLELHVAHSCNLACQSCSHYANYKIGGTVNIADAAVWIQNWSKIIAPLRFSLLGGEPLLNKDWPCFVEIVRSKWPDTELRLVTNGLLLGQLGAEAWGVLARAKARLTVSVHSDEPEYRARLHASISAAQEKAKGHDIAWEFRDSTRNWRLLYEGEGSSIRPYAHGDARKSWARCMSRHCVVLQDNALWKCPHSARFPALARRYSLADEPAWQPALAYRPLTIEATESELIAFFAARQEDICATCPAEPISFIKKIY